MEEVKADWIATSRKGKHPAHTETDTRSCEHLLHISDGLRSTPENMFSESYNNIVTCAHAHTHTIL